MKKILYIIGAAIIIFAALMVTGGCVDTSRENSVKITGIVSNITEGGVKDAVFELKGNKISYYINRGLENGFTLDGLKQKHIGSEVTIYYAKVWTPLAPFGTTSKHISRLESNDSIVYTEF